MTFEELRAFICESPRGQVLDSLVCVELGLEEYRAAWEAICDMNPDCDWDRVIVAFLVDVCDYIGVAESDFEKVLAHAEQ